MIDAEFERLLEDIFGKDFIEYFKKTRPTGWAELMGAFEADKRAANPFAITPLNIVLPFPFITLYKTIKGYGVGSQCFFVIFFLSQVNWNHLNYKKS